MDDIILILGPEHCDWAARGLFESVNRRPGKQRAIYLKRISGSGECPRQLAEHEYFWDPGGKAGFYPTCETSPEMEAVLRFFLKHIHPNSIYIQIDPAFNFAILELIRTQMEAIPIYLSVLDYHYICPLSSQMLFPSGNACKNPAPAKCVHCIQGISQSELWQRQRRFNHFINLADGIIVPANFMLNRYLEHGYIAEKLCSVEPCLPRLRTGYFPKKVRNYSNYTYIGPVNPASGIQRILGALANLAPEIQKKISIHIYSPPLSDQPAEFQAEIKTYLGQLRNLNNVSWQAEPISEELPQLVNDADWLLAPALWGEALSLPIGIARRMRIPVIAAGDACHGEKISHMETGLLVGETQPMKHWEEALKATAGNASLWEKICAAIEDDGQNILDDNLRVLGLLEDVWDF